MMFLQPECVMKCLGVQKEVCVHGVCCCTRRNSVNSVDDSMSASTQLPGPVCTYVRSGCLETLIRGKLVKRLGEDKFLNGTSSEDCTSRKF